MSFSKYHYNLSLVVVKTASYLLSYTDTVILEVRLVISSGTGADRKLIFLFSLVWRKARKRADSAPCTSMS